MYYIPIFLISLLPLQNIYIGKLQSLGSGLNALNILFAVSLFHCLKLTKTNNNIKTSKLVILMIAGYVLSYLWGGMRAGFDEEGLFVLKDTLLPYLLFFIVYRICDSMKSMRHIFYATLLPMPYMFKVFYSNLSWMGFSSYQDKLRSNNGTFMLLGSNEIAAFYATYTFIILAIAFKESNKNLRWGLYAISAMNIYCIVYAFSRGAYLSSLAAISVLCLLNGKFKQLGIVVILLFVLSASGIKVLPNAVFQRFDSAFVAEEDLDESVQKRLILWDIAKAKFAENPIIGIGYRNFVKENPYKMDTHNFYLKTLVEGGVVGFTILVSFLLHALRRGIALHQMATDPFLKALAAGFISCMIAMVFGNFFGDRFTHYPLISYFFVYLAMVVKGIEWSTQKREETDSNPAFDKQ